jgi:hypothetical protein
MDKKLEKIKKFRFFILDQISNLTAKQLNAIPEGFSNNILWNLGHLVATVQAICYKRAGLPITIDDRYFTPFLPTTKPDDVISTEEIEVIKNLLISTIDTLQTDLDNKVFGNYTKSERIEQVYGVNISTIEDALEFLLYHEGVHSGYIARLKQFVSA